MTDTVRAAFADQAVSCRALGSELTARVCERLGAALHPAQGPVAARVLHWPGDPTSRGDSLPLRLAGALHALVLSGQAPDLARAYAAGDPATADLLSALRDHAAEIDAWLDSPPQTNEVARSAAILAAARFVATLTGLPLSALELGASAGLNLNFHRYQLAPNTEGPAQDQDGPILRPQWEGTVPEAMVHVAQTRGVDLRPLDPTDDGARLLAYTWPDQPARMARLRAALTVAQRHPPRVDRGDAADWLAARLSEPVASQARFLFHTVAWQYFPAAIQDACVRIITDAGARATPDTPLAWFGMEADGAGPGAGLVLRLWDGHARAWALGRADFHGRWITWAPQPIAPLGLWEARG